MAIFHQQWHWEKLAKRALSGLEVDGLFYLLGRGAWTKRLTRGMKLGDSLSLTVVGTVW